MMISTRGRYALRVMTELAERYDEGFISLKSVSQNQQISEKYMESIISLLVKNDFVEGVRGKGGGYRLTKPAEEYSVGSILTITEGSLAPVACLEGNDLSCQRSCDCRTLPIWQKLDEIINDYLEGIKLSDLCNR